MLGLLEFFWGGNAPLQPPPSTIPANAGGGGKGGTKGHPNVQYNFEDLSKIREAYLKRMHGDIETEDDMRKNKELEAENKDYAAQLIELRGQLTGAQAATADLAQKNAQISAIATQMRQQLSDPIVQAAIAGDWNTVRDALVSKGQQANTASDILGVIRTLSKS